MFQLPFLDQIRNFVSYSSIDEFTDVLSCFATAFIFLFGAILISARTYVGSPIQCWLPQTFSSSWEEYAETYCFLKNTYFVPDSERVTSDFSEATGSMGVSYYQWASIYLTLMALGFILPKLAWHKIQGLYDISLLYFCETAQHVKMMTKAERASKIEEMSVFLRTKLERDGYRMGSTKRSWLAISYIGTKLLYLFNIFVQFVLLAWFLGHSGNYFWGYDILTNLSNNLNWEHTGIFPRITYCQYKTRAHGGEIQSHVIQCVLGVNEFNEKIFTFIWIWIVFVLYATLIGIGISLYQLSQNTIVNKLLHTIDSRDIEKRAIVEKFKRYLGKDGVLILGFVKGQSEVVARELVEHLFDHFMQNHIDRLENVYPKNLQYSDSTLPIKAPLDENDNQ